MPAYSPRSFVSPTTIAARNCTKCIEACPSGALQPGKQAKFARPIGFPQVDMDVCLLGNDRDCSACSSACPYEAITLLFVEADYTVRLQINQGKCPGCGACEVACPTTPKAIVVRPFGVR